MKYFTRELLALTQSTNPETLDEWESRWEESGERYALYLDQVRDCFPSGIRRLFSRYYLHDATIHRIAQKEKVFLIELQLDSPPRSFLTFHYRLLRPAEINKESLPVACRAKGVEVDWLYAEIERLSAEEVLSSPSASTWIQDSWLAQAIGFDQKSGSKWPFWEHRILLSNGWELKLYFHDVEVEEYEDVLMPVTDNGRIAARQSASPSA